MENQFYSAMSYNIFNWDASEAHFSRMVAVIRKYLPDTIGFQEITATWIGRLLRVLPEYGCVGADRSDFTHERSAIFFRTDKFICLECGTKWLSDTPVVPSKFSDSEFMRVMSYVRLECRETGKELVHANLHLDLNEVVNTKQVNVALAFLKNQYSELPCMLSGDFNADIFKTPMPTPLATVLEQMRDSRTIAKETHGIGSWHGRDSVAPQKKALDYIFVSEHLEIEKHIFVDDLFTDGFPTDSDFVAINAGAVSDHNPVYITYQF